MLSSCSFIQEPQFQTLSSMAISSLSSFDYKKWGHAKIDRLVQLGIPRDTVYARLKKRLKHPSHGGHFANVDDPQELERMVRVLDTMVKAQEIHLGIVEVKPISKKSPTPSKNSLKKVAKRRYKNEVFTDPQVLRQVALRNTRRLSFITRALLFLKSKLGF